MLISLWLLIHFFCTKSLSSPKISLTTSFLIFSPISSSMSPLLPSSRALRTFSINDQLSGGLSSLGQTYIILIYIYTGEIVFQNHISLIFYRNNGIKDILCRDFSIMLICILVKAKLNKSPTQSVSF